MLFILYEKIFVHHIIYTNSFIRTMSYVIRLKPEHID